MDKFCVLWKTSKSFGLSFACNDTFDIQSQTHAVWLVNLSALHKMCDQ